MKKIIFPSIFLLIVIFVAVMALKSNQHSPKSQLAIEKTEDNKGIIVGAKSDAPDRNNPDTWTPETRQRVQQYQNDVKAVDEAWENISLGGNLAKAGNYEDAITAYKKAYAQDSGSKAFVGIYRLIPAYEKLGRYDEALQLLNEMEREIFKGEAGVKTAQEIRARLLAAKNAVVPQSNNG